MRSKIVAIQIKIHTLKYTNQINPLPKPSKSPHQKSQKQQFLQKYDSHNPRKIRTLIANTHLKSLFYGDLRFG